MSALNSYSGSRSGVCGVNYDATQLMCIVVSMVRMNEHTDRVFIQFLERRKNNFWKEGHSNSLTHAALACHSDKKVGWSLD